MNGLHLLALIVLVFLATGIREWWYTLSDTLRLYLYAIAIVVSLFLVWLRLMDRAAERLELEAWFSSKHKPLAPIIPFRRN